MSGDSPSLMAASLQHSTTRCRTPPSGDYPQAYRQCHRNDRRYGCITAALAMEDLSCDVITAIVTGILARVPDWIRQDLGSKDTRRRPGRKRRSPPQLLILEPVAPPQLSLRDRTFQIDHAHARICPRLAVARTRFAGVAFVAKLRREIGSVS